MPVEERHGGLWFWPGDGDAADPALIPDFDFIDAGGPIERAQYVMAVPYELIADNLLDLSHAEFLHVESFGTNGSLFSHGAQSVEQDATGAIWNKWDMTGAPPPGWAMPMLAEGETVDQKLHIRWHAPASLALFIEMRRSGADAPMVPPMANPHILTPETATSTHYFFTHAPGEAEAAMARRVFLEEDEPMIAAQAEAMAGEDFWDLRPLILPSDKAARRHEKRPPRMGRPFHSRERDGLRRDLHLLGVRGRRHERQIGDAVAHGEAELVRARCDAARLKRGDQGFFTEVPAVIIDRFHLVERVGLAAHGEAHISAGNGFAVNRDLDVFDHGKAKAAIIRQPREQGDAAFDIVEAVLDDHQLVHHGQGLLMLRL
jgi:hypothetical protein